MAAGGEEPLYETFGGPFLAHEGGVGDLAFHHSGALLATCGADGVRLWAPGSGEPSQVVWQGNATSLAFDPGGDRLYVGSEAGEVLAADVFKDEVEMLSRNEAPVRALAVNRDGRLLAVAHSDGEVKLWHPNTRRLIAALGLSSAQVNAVAFSADGKQLAVGAANGVWLVSGFDSGDLRPYRVHLAEAPATALAFVAGDEKLLVAVDADRSAVVPLSDVVELDGLRALRLVRHPDGAMVASGGTDGVVLLDTATQLPRGGPLTTGTLPVSLAFSPDGEFLAAGCADGMVHMWETPRRPVARTAIDEGRRHGARVTAVAASDDGSVTVSGDSTGQVIRWSPGGADQLTWLDSSVRSVHVNRDGSVVVANGEDESIRLWASVGAVGVRQLRVDDVLAISPDGGALVTSTEGHTDVMTLRRPRRKDVAHLPQYLDAAVFRTDDQLILGGTEGEVWSVSLGVAAAPVQLVPQGRQAVRCLAVAPDRLLVAVGHAGGMVEIHDREPNGWRDAGRFQLGGEPAAVAFVGDTGDVVAVTRDGIVSQFPQGFRSVVEAEDVTAVALSRDGSTVVAGTARGEVTTHRVDSLFSAPNEQPLTEVVVTADADVAATVDRLGAAREAKGVARVLGARQTGTPFAVALLGEWGSGKSTFMNLLEAELHLLSRMAAARVVEARDVTASAYCAGIRQVRFNAWHYADDHLWAGLIRHLLRELAGEPAVDAAGSQLTGQERAELTQQIAVTRADLAEVEADILAAEQPPAGFRWFRWLTGAGGENARTFAAADNLVRELLRRWRAVGWVGLALIAVGTAGVVLGRTVFSFHGLLTGAVAAVGVAGVVVETVHRWMTGSLKEWRDRLKEIADAGLGGAPVPGQEAQQARRAALAARVEQLEAELAATDPARRLTRFLDERRDSSDYGAYQGLLSLVHDDLSKLGRLIADHERSWSGSSVPPLQRVVLYVDDLDRCEPKRVVEVLAAIHLILALPLFVVLVAVDPRWLLRCLRHHYVELLDTTADDHHLGVHASTPIAYLEKIFQVAYEVPPMASDLSGLVADLMPERRPRPADDGPAPGPAPAAGLPPSTPGPGSPTDDEASAPPAAPDPSDLPEGMPIEANTPEPLPEPEIWAPGPRPQPVVDEQPLDFDAAEIERVVTLGPLLGTPRTLKRLVNVYRMIRATLPEAELQRLAGEHGYALVLLAIALGQPLGAPWVFAVIRTTTEPHLLPALEAALRPTAPDRDDGNTNADPRPDTESVAGDPVDDLPTVSPEARADLARLITSTLTDGAVPLDDVERYRHWLPIVARYSFRYRPLLG